MAKTLNQYSSSLSPGKIIKSDHINQFVDAFTGNEAYDILISGSLTLNGTNINDQFNLIDDSLFYRGHISVGHWDDIANRIVTNTLVPGNYGLHLTNAFNGYNDMSLTVEYASGATTGANGKQDYIVKITTPDGKIYIGRGYYDEANDFVS